MNSAELIGRLVRDPELRNGATAFTIAVDRPKREGDEKAADFIPIVTFGKQADVCGRFLTKGRLVGITGSIRTGSYEGRDGKTVHTTEVVASRVDFMDSPERKAEPERHSPAVSQMGFDDVSEEMPF